MSILMITDETKEQVKKLIELATAKPYSIEQVRVLAEGFNPQDVSTRPKERVNVEFTMHLSLDYTVTYTHEYQPIGLCRHISVSLTKQRRGVKENPHVRMYPSPLAVSAIMKLFGFVSTLDEALGWEEKCAGGFGAINIVEVIGEKGASECRSPE